MASLFGGSPTSGGKGVTIKVRADTAGAAQDLERLTSTVERMDNRMSKLGSTVKIAATAFAGFSVINKAMKSMSLASDEFVKMEGKIGLLTGTGDAMTKTFRSLQQVAHETRTPLAGNVDVFSRLGYAMKGSTATAEDLVKVTESLGMALRLSYAEGPNAANALDAFATAMSRGYMNAVDYNRLVEQAPRIVESLAKQLKISMGEMKQAVTDGRVDIKTMMGAMKDDHQDLYDEYWTTGYLTSSWMVSLKDQVAEFWYNIDKAFGVSTVVQKGLERLYNSFRWINQNFDNIILALNIQLNKYKQVWNEFTAWTSNFSKQIIKTFAFDGLGAAITELGTEFSRLGGIVGDFVSDKALAGWEKLGEISSGTMFEGSFAGLETARVWVSDKTRAISDSLRGMVTSIPALFKRYDLDITFHSAFKGIGKAYNYVSDKVGQIVQVISGLASSVKNYMMDFFAGIDWQDGWSMLASVQERLKSFTDAIIEFFRNLWDKIVGNSYWPDTWWRGPDAIAGTRTQTALDDVQSWVKTALDFIIAQFENFQNIVTNLWGKVLDFVTYDPEQKTPFSFQRMFYDPDWDRDAQKLKNKAQGVWSSLTRDIGDGDSTPMTPSKMFGIAKQTQDNLMRTLSEGGDKKRGSINISGMLEQINIGESIRDWLSDKTHVISGAVVAGMALGFKFGFKKVFLLGLMGAVGPEVLNSETFQAVLKNAGISIGQTIARAFEGDGDFGSRLIEGIKNSFAALGEGFWEGVWPQKDMQTGFINVMSGILGVALVGSAFFSGLRGIVMGGFSQLMGGSSLALLFARDAGVSLMGSMITGMRTISLSAVVTTMAMSISNEDGEMIGSRLALGASNVAIWSAQGAYFGKIFGKKGQFAGAVGGAMVGGLIAVWADPAIIDDAAAFVENMWDDAGKWYMESIAGKEGEIALKLLEMFGKVGWYMFVGMMRVTAKVTNWLLGLLVDFGLWTFNSLKGSGSDIGNWLRGLLKDFGEWVMEGLSPIADRLDQFFNNTVRNIGDAIYDAIAGVAGKLKALITGIFSSSSIKGFQDGAESIETGMGPPSGSSAANKAIIDKLVPITRADGGPIYGEGTATSDSIPAMLSNGEYVIKASSVGKYGHGLLDLINSGNFPMKGFKDGGAVGGGFGSSAWLASELQKAKLELQRIESKNVSAQMADPNAALINTAPVENTIRRLYEQIISSSEGKATQLIGHGKNAGTGIGGSTGSTKAGTGSGKDEDYMYVEEDYRFDQYNKAIEEAHARAQQFYDQFRDNFASGLSKLIKGDMSFKEYMLSIVDQFTGSVTDSIIAGFTDGLLGEDGLNIKGIFDSFDFKGLGEQFSSGLMSIFSGGAGGGGISGIFGAITSIFGFMSSGGIVPNVPGSQVGKDSVPTMLMPGERVMNTNQVRNSMGNGGGGGSSTFNINVTGDVTKQTRRQILDMIPEIASGVNSDNHETNFQYSR